MSSVGLTAVDKSFSLFHQVGCELVWLEELSEADRWQTPRPHFEPRPNTQQHDENGKVDIKPIADYNRRGSVHIVYELYIALSLSRDELLIYLSLSLLPDRGDSYK